jgi:hypothetical protein
MLILLLISASAMNIREFGPGQHFYTPLNVLSAGASGNMCNRAGGAYFELLLENPSGTYEITVGRGGNSTFNSNGYEGMCGIRILITPGGDSAFYIATGAT